RITTESSGLTTTHALTSVAVVAACASSVSKGTCRPRASPPPTAVELMMNWRRFMRGICFMIASLRLGRGVDRLAHLLEGATAADMGDRCIDVRVGGLRLVLQQCRRRHDHSGLAIAALGHVVLEPRLLHLAQPGAGGETFDGGDLLADHRADRQHARTR